MTIMITSESLRFLFWAAILLLAAIAVFASKRLRAVIFDTGRDRFRPILLGVLTVSACVVLIIWLPMFLVHRATAPTIAELRRVSAQFEPEAAQFWRWFPSIEDRLYVARDDGDPVISTLRAKLEEICPGMTFKLGPMHGKRRELAFSNPLVLQRGSRTSAAYLVRTAKPTSPDHWLVGMGLEGPKPMFSMRYASAAGEITATNSDFSFSACPNGDLIDVIVYSDLPNELGTDSLLRPVTVFLKHNLGEKFYRLYLGKVSVEKRSGRKSGENLLTIDHVYPDFLKRLTANKNSDLNSCFSSKPCISAGGVEF
ncbi:MAG: hypothetical protein JSS83_16210 [Cyanobacteria bacterium SZAS LIN-3]|nr:hypothetical protein [Cyanobacteria bacterium SZAS LIN-3]